MVNSGICAFILSQQPFQLPRCRFFWSDGRGAALAGWWKATSDVHLEILEIVESEGLVTLRYTLTGTHDGDLFGMPASGRKFHVENCTLLRVEDGKVKNAYRYSDTLGLMTQLGAIPGR